MNELEAVAILKRYPNCVMATIDSEGNPHTRVMQFLFTLDGKLYYCTNSTKKVSKQIKLRPQLSILAFSPDFSEVSRINGSAVFVDDLDLKARALDENPQIKSIYKEASNTAFELFYVDRLTIE